MPMRAIRFVLQSALALVAAVPLAHAQSVSINATITGEIAPGVYGRVVLGNRPPPPVVYAQPLVAVPVVVAEPVPIDRKSTRLNSSHSQISYAVFCLKKKTTIQLTPFQHSRRSADVPSPAEGSMAPRSLAMWLRTVSWSRAPRTCQS